MASRLNLLHVYELSVEDIACYLGNTLEFCSYLACIMSYITKGISFDLNYIIPCNPGSGATTLSVLKLG